MYKFIQHEWRFWLRSPMLYIFLLINTLLVMGAVSSEQIQIGGGVGSVYKNAPSVVQSYYGMMSLICLLMTTAFLNASANRDFSSGMYQFVFSSPIKKAHYFFGKFIGAFTIAVIPLLGISIGALIGPLMPWAPETRYGPVILDGHLQGIIGFAIPNTFIAATLIYGLAQLFRSNLISFVGAFGILILYSLSQGFTADLEKEWLANLLDPFGFQPLNTLTKYRTIEEQNLTAGRLEGQFLFNRLLWIGIGMLILMLLYSRFSFQTRDRKASKKARKASEAEFQMPAAEVVRSFAPSRQKTWSLHSFWHLLRFETAAVMRNQTFIILTIIGLANLIAGLTSFTGNYGTAQYPVTYQVVDAIRGSYSIFVIAIIVFYTGVLVWKERDARISEIEDATPVSLSLLFFPKLLGLIVSLAVLYLAAIFTGMVAQSMYGYTRFELDVYLKSLLLIDLSKQAIMAVLALLVHYLINNRYIGYFAFIAIVITNSFIWSAFEINTNMLPYGARPDEIYSDMNGFGPFVPGLLWFTLYWSLFALVLLLVGRAFYVRGKETAFKTRIKLAGQRLKQQKMALALVILAFATTAGWVYYNTQVINTYYSSKQYEQMRKDYELQYKQYEQLPQPGWQSISYQIDLYPEERKLLVTADAWLYNKHAAPIESIHFSLPSMPDSVRIDIVGATQSHYDYLLGYQIFSLTEPLQPGDSLPVRFYSHNIHRGFENEVSHTAITRNGSFFNNFDILPTIGYNRSVEIGDKNKRVKLGLPPRKRLPDLNEADDFNRNQTYIGNTNDWVQVHTIFSTSADQTAVAPGSLLKSWTENGRNYFEYALDHPSLNFYSFISATYEVARKKWNGIDLEVYHIKEHAYNVPNMLQSMEKSLEYYTTHFGPYKHKQCRIIEFPRYASFAQAFPGTMPYSEGIGFIADLRKVTDDDIDLVYYVVAHEMGHQYWAHQLVGANMRGSEMLSESFAQYSALMVMEKTYGRDKMKKFLRYEMNGYLRGRANEYEAERPIIETENQGYIHYQKGSVVMYYLKEMIGEAQVNAALQKLLADHAYQPAPYPTSLHAVRAFREVTPDSLQYLIDDMFENITLFSNRVLEASYEKEGEGYRVYVSTSSEKFRADSLGRETAAPLRDYIDIGLFGPSKGSKQAGKPLLLERRLITQAENSFSFYVNELPVQAGIDPYNYLVDRMPDDNLKKVVAR